MFVAVGSANPVKADATRQAFSQVWPTSSADVESVAVPSGVSAQPMNDVECIEGARNRAILAREALDADYGVGIEGGLVHVGGLWFNGGWVVVVDREFREGLGSTFRVPVPSVVMRRIEHGAELAEALDEALGVTDTKYGPGHFGHMTNGVVTRTHGYVDAVAAALARFAHPTLFR
ncbi:MAG TPA: inosine/xanthosine triphosphatase [Streptosporangiales bacterium]